MEGWQGLLFPVALLLVAFCVPFSSARPMCILARTERLHKDVYWIAAIPAYNSPKLNQHTQIEWEIWADIDDMVQESVSFLPWKDDVLHGNNAVRVPNSDIPLHKGMTSHTTDHSFINTHDADRQEAVLSVSMASTDAKKEGFLWLKLWLWMSASEPQNWPSVGDDLSNWKSQVQVQFLDPKYNKWAVFEALNDLTVNITNCTPLEAK